MISENNKRYIYNNPSTEDWSGLWKSNPSDPDVSNDEYETVYEAFEKWLGGIGTVGYSDGCDFYFRGDNYGDRTQYLEIVIPSALRMETLMALQGLLQMPRFAHWRIVIPTYLDAPSGIMVYPAAIVVGKPGHEITLSELDDIQRRMLARRNRKDQ